MQSSDSDANDAPSDAPVAPVAVAVEVEAARPEEARPEAARPEEAVRPEEAATSEEAAGPEEGDGADPSDTFPMLRPLDAYPVDGPGGQKFLALADPSGIAPGVVTLPPFGAAVIELFDGSRKKDEICAEFLARYRRPLPKESLDALLQKLDDALMLDSTRFRLHCARIYAEFAGLETRPAMNAGSRYPSDPEALRKLLAEAFAPPSGPALPKDRPAAEGHVQSPPRPGPRVIVTPTVDIERGGPAYAWAYRPLFEVDRLPSLIVLVGCDHAAHDALVTLTRKHFATPLGTLQTDVELVDALLADATARDPNLGELLIRDEAHHRGEHALEFAAVWLRYVLEWRKAQGLDEQVAPPRILPILCGSLHELAQNPPSRDSKLEPQQTTHILDVFSSILQQRIGEKQRAGAEILWIAATDLAHVGPRFGDLEPLSEGDRDSLERRDKDTLKPVLHGDAQSFLAELRRERDRRRVLALGPLYFLLNAAMPGTGRLRCYAQCSVDAGSYISTASLIYP
jgi:predicted class III extradiol MEMO1 family dioxygenase